MFKKSFKFNIKKKILEINPKVNIYIGKYVPENLKKFKNDDFIAWIQAVRTGTNAKGEKYIENWDKYTKFIDENIGHAVDAGLINKPKLDIIANTIVPGTEDDKRYPLLGPDGKPNGKYGQTYAQKWPTKFGYDPDEQPRL